MLNTDRPIATCKSYHMIEVFDHVDKTCLCNVMGVLTWYCHGVVVESRCIGKRLYCITVPKAFKVVLNHYPVPVIQDLR